MGVRSPQALGHFGLGCSVLALRATGGPGCALREALRGRAVREAAEPCAPPPTPPRPAEQAGPGGSVHLSSRGMLGDGPAGKLRLPGEGPRGRGEDAGLLWRVWFGCVFFLFCYFFVCLVWVCLFVCFFYKDLREARGNGAAGSALRQPLWRSRGRAGLCARHVMLAAAVRAAVGLSGAARLGDAPAPPSARPAARPQPRR